MKERLRALTGALALAALGLFGATPASAATVVGETFVPSVGARCVADFTRLQTQSAGDRYVVPFAGILTSWSTLAGDTPAQFKLKVGRPQGGNVFTIVGSSDVQAPTPSQLNTYPVQIPVQAGDILGLYTPTAGDCLRDGGLGYGFHFITGDATGNTTFNPGGDTLQFDISAVLEADADCDGLGDESQDPGFDPNGCSPGDSSPPTASITDGPNDKTKKKTATFVFAGDDKAVASFQCSLDGAAFAACTSPHTVKVKKGKHTFQVQAIDQAGNVGAPAGDSWKRKKKKKK